MKFQVESQKLIKPCFYSFKIISFFLFIIAGATSSQNTKCPFQYLYHFGDGFTDIGNSIKVLPWGPFLPAARLPYGKTYPGKPTGRWSDGRTDFDYAAADFGLPNIVPYLSMNASTSYDGVIFSVARSPVLDRIFFASRGINIPPSVVPLSVQLSWFKTYLKSICSNPTDCANRLGNSLVLFGDIEGLDTGYSLTQGKSIEEVKSYVPFTIQALIEAAKELIKMGATRVIIPENAPLGCYPYILTALPSNDSAAYDDLGCLKNVNDFILSRNNDLQQAVKNLSSEFPNATVYYGSIYDGAITIINETSAQGNGTRTNALKACCGIGGKYNYDSKRFCGSPGVPVCPNPDKYIYWDGLHFTQEAYARMERILVQPALVSLNCTSN
ncbi:hypothetical protein Pfo_007108 [Paulownia fortunei]|nr:hypothetical protein Pfo_007108 [Paulownia fortunei]